jgi:hypothetical protein
MKLGSRAQVLASVLISVSIVGTGIGFAAAAGSGSAPRAISACADSRAHGRTLHVISASGHCAPGQTKLTWMTAGKRGPRGHVGKTGAKGATGQRGASGLNYKRIITVSPAATPTASGAALMAVDEGLSSVSPAPSATDPLEIFVEPGTYLIGKQTFIHLPAHVDLVGAGEDLTTISATNDDGVVGGPSGAGSSSEPTTVSNLTIIDTGDGTETDGLDGITADADWHIDHVRVMTQSTSLSCSGENNFGIHAFGGPVTISDTSVSAQGCSSQGVFSMFDYTVTSSKIVAQLTGGAPGVAVSNGDLATAHLADTELGGSTDINGSIACVGDYNDSFVALSTSCQ